MVLLQQRVDHNQHNHTHTHQRHAAKQKKRGGTRRGIITEIPRREVCSHTPITLATMSEEASTRSTAASQASQASQASAGGSSSADKGPAAADPTASEEAIDEMLAANDPPRKKQRQRSGARDTSPCSTACLMAQNAGHIAQTCRRSRSHRAVRGDSDPCAVFELNHLEPAFLPHPCAETPTRAELSLIHI